MVDAPAATALTAVPQTPQRVSVEDYLADEQRTGVKHGYLDGPVVAMGGASRRRGSLTLSLSALLLPHARCQGCQLFAGDMKVRINHDQGSWFYYPDLVLACDPSDNEPLFVQRPCLLVEVLSPSTEQTDTREKLLAYRLLPSLREYLLLRQDVLQADLYQRGEDGRWRHRRFSAPPATTCRWPACPRPAPCCAMSMPTCPT